MRHELFIYYRAPAAHGDALVGAVRHMQQRLAAEHPGLEARLLLRADPGGVDLTWMETYRLPPDAEAAALAEAIATAAQTLLPWLSGPRHVEHFVPCAW